MIVGAVLADDIDDATDHCNPSMTTLDMPVIQVDRMRIAGMMPHREIRRDYDQPLRDY